MLFLPQAYITTPTVEIIVLVIYKKQQSCRQLLKVPLKCPIFSFQRYLSEFCAWKYSWLHTFIHITNIYCITSSHMLVELLVLTNCIFKLIRVKGRYKLQRLKNLGCNMPFLSRMSFIKLNGTIKLQCRALRSMWRCHTHMSTNHFWSICHWCSFCIPSVDHYHQHLC